MSPLAESILQTVAAALAASVVLVGFIRSIGLRHFDSAVLGSLERERPRFKDIVEKTTPVLAVQAMAEKAHQTVTRIEDEFRDFRRAVDPKLSDAVMLGKTIADLDRSVVMLNTTLRDLHEAHAETREELAALRGEVQSRRRIS